MYRTGAAISATDAQYASAPFGRSTDIALGITLFATFFTSSLYGIDATSRCNDQKQAEDERIRRQRREHEEAGNEPCLARGDGAGRCATPPRIKLDQSERDTDTT